jgi:sarcosine oxidase delta subunit
MISSLSAGGIKISFDRIKKDVTKSGKCPYCGKKATRTTTFEMHKGFFNRNDDGSEMSEEQIQEVVNKKAVAWKSDMEVYHNSCRRNLVITRLRSENFICTEQSDCIEAWLSPSHSIRVNYDKMRIPYEWFTKTDNLDDLVSELIKYQQSFNSRVIDIAKMHIAVDKEKSSKCGKHCIHTSIAKHSVQSYTNCYLEGMGNSDDEAFNNALTSLISLGEAAKQYLEATCNS